LNQQEFNRTFKNWVGLCYWTRMSVCRTGVCYKEIFYGIPSHQCVEFTPMPDRCNLDCVFCWRACKDLSFNQPLPRLTSIENYLDKMLTLRNTMMAGLGSHPYVDSALLKDSYQAKYWTFSYTGEPTLAEDLPQMLDDLKKRGSTVLLVTNGTRPEVIEKLKTTLPDQFYLSLNGYDRESFFYLTRPRSASLWKKHCDFALEFSRLKCRKVLRVTMLENFNMDEKAAAGYAHQIKLIKPEYVELKSFARLGQSIDNFPKEAVPTHARIMNFAQQVSRASGYRLSCEHERARVALLCRDQQTEADRLLVKV
jgi:tRNA wybutosine-synthesizing protein 1